MPAIPVGVPVQVKVTSQKELISDILTTNWCSHQKASDSRSAPTCFPDVFSIAGGKSQRRAPRSMRREPLPKSSPPPAGEFLIIDIGSSKQYRAYQQTPAGWLECLTRSWEASQSDSCRRHITASRELCFRNEKTNDLRSEHCAADCLMDSDPHILSQKTPEKVIEARR